MSFLSNIFSRQPSQQNSQSQNSIPNTKLSFQIQSSKEYEELNKIIKEFTIINKIEDYNQYIKELNTILFPKNIFSSELEYRYNKINNTLQNPIKNIPEIEMIKKVGKIGKKQTQFDEKSAFDKMKYQNNYCKIESITNFSSIRTNNCIFKGKWCYEVNLITNGLMQIGFCQLNTEFSRREGVGDDKTSFAYDGWRKVIWNKGSIDYGKIWDIGDVVGVCIDIDNRKIEYYLNGVKLGNAFNDIPFGENIAFFPGISLSQGEKCCFNFGNLPFYFNYDNYEPFDIPISKINKIDDVTNKILGILDKYVYDVLIRKDVSDFNKINVSYLIFEYLINVSFFDVFVIRFVLLPYMIKLSDNMERFKIFVDYLINFCTKDKKVNLVKFFFDVFSNTIEEFALMGEKKINEWISHIRLFKNLLKIDSIVNIWIESGTIDTLKNIFTSNFFRFPVFYEYLSSKNRFNDPTKTVYEAVNEIKTEFFDKNEELYYKINNDFTNEMSDLLSFILIDKRKFGSNSNIILKDKLNELIKNGFGLNSLDDIFNVIGGLQNQSKEESLFFKNIYYPVINVFLKDYINKPFETISIEPWFNRQIKDSIYYDDVGIGGTISSVTTEYIDKIDNKFNVKSNEFYSHFFHQIIKMGDDLFINPILKRFEKTRSKSKNTPLSQLIISNHGIKSFENVFRKDFYLFSLHSQIIFYKFSYFIIKFIMWLKEQNKDILYFIPNCVIELPFALFKTLVKLHSKILSEPEFRKKINKDCEHFKNDDYIKNILKLYLYLFADNKIKNPELRENLLTKVNFMTKKQILMKFFDDDEEFFDNLIKGLLNDMTGDALSHYACRVLLKIIAPICFGKENEGNNQKLINKIQKYFSGNQEILKDFLKNYSKFINQIMTEYTINLSNITSKYKNGLSDVPIQTKLPLLQAISSSYNLMCDLLKINEFFIVIYPDFFLDINSLNYTHLVNIITNLGTRILSSPYIDHLINIGNELDKIYKDIENKNNNNNNNEINQKRRINLLNLGYSTVGIFLKLNLNKNKENYQIFQKTFANIADIRFEPFKQLYNRLIKLVTDDFIKQKIKEYYNIILSFEKLRNYHDLTDEQMDKLIAKDELCIICYERLSNMEILPCKHSACEVCLKQYMNDKDICFICHNKIEKIEKIKIKEDLNKMDIDS